MFIKIKICSSKQNSTFWILIIGLKHRPHISYFDLMKVKMYLIGQRVADDL